MSLQITNEMWENWIVACKLKVILYFTCLQTAVIVVELFKQQAHAGQVDILTPKM